MTGVMETVIIISAFVAVGLLCAIQLTLWAIYQSLDACYHRLTSISNGTCSCKEKKCE